MLNRTPGSLKSEDTLSCNTKKVNARVLHHIVALLISLGFWGMFCDSTLYPKPLVIDPTELSASIFPTLCKVVSSLSRFGMKLEGYWEEASTREECFRTPFNPDVDR